MARRSTLVRITGLAGMAASASAWAQPNNGCGSATPLPLGGSVVGSTAGATTDGSASCGTSNSTPDVWHSLYVPCGGELTLYTCPVGYDTVISVHSGCPGTAGNEIACNDDSLYCGAAYPRASALTVPVSPGTYLIRVSGFNGATGVYTLNGFVTPTAPPNDNCVNAAYFGGGVVAGCTGAATVDGSATCGGSNATPDVWYYYPAPCDGTLDLFTCPVAYDTVISVHSGCPGTESNQIACNDDSAYCGAAYPRASYLPVPVAGGNAYLIRVSGFNGASGAFVLNGNFTPAAPPNDVCVNATPIGEGAFVGSTACATIDGQTTCGDGNHADVWYRYTAPCSGTLDVYTCPASFDTMLSVHTGCPGAAANQLECNNDSAYCGSAYPLTSYIPMPVVAGSTYLIRVSGRFGQTGTFVLNTHLQAASNDLCANAIPIGDGAIPFSNCGATTDGPAEPGLCNFHGEPQISSDLWYRYTAMRGGSASVSLCNSGYDTEIAIYGSACPAASGQVIACNDDSVCGLTSYVIFPTTAGQQYLVRVGGFGSSRGSGTMVISGCYANCDASTTSPILNVADFACFLNRFASGNAYANCDGSTTPPVLTVADFGCFLNAFASGCQ